MKPLRKTQPVDKRSEFLFEKILLCITLGLTVLRLTIVEAPQVDTVQTRLMLSSENISLLLSGCILLCAGLWVLAAVLSGRLRWRRTGFAPAAVAFMAAGIIAACFASDKRSAVTDTVTLAAPVLSALMLIQWLRTAAMIRLALLLILAVGIAATVQCIDQRAESNEMLVAEYEADPAEHLEKLGIEPDSMEHWMYEHRVYSKDIRGFLMTSNSAATFFLLAFFANVGLVLQLLSKKITQAQLAALVCYLLTGAVIFAGLFLTQSKGGIGSFLLGTTLLVVLLALGQAIWKRRVLFGILLLVLIVVAAGFIIQYGVQNGRLPGGNAMLVRWQYWASAARMIGDHPLTGVGGGNFSEFYTHYKTPAASETVQNPHSWIVSLLSQYGPLGLIAFAAAVCVVLFKGLHHGLSLNRDSKNQPDESKEISGHLWVGLLASSSLLLLFVRPLLVDAEFLYHTPDVRAAAYLVLYLIPAGVFIAVFLLLWAACCVKVDAEQSGRRLAVALVCGLVAVLIHNLIDFAIFESGNWSLFWLLAAILIAQIHNNKEQSDKVIVLDPSKRMGIAAGLLIVSVLYLAVVLLPPMRADRLFRQALRNGIRQGELLDAATAVDTLSPKTAYRAAGLLKQVYHYRNDKTLLEKAALLAHIAADRNPAGFKPLRLLGEVNVFLAEQAQGPGKGKYLQAAFDAFQQAIQRYPGSGRLHFNLASVAEQLGRDEIALCHYQTAVDIEDAYRSQFRIMYPDQKTVISRLGAAVYTEAKSKIQALSGEQEGLPLEKK